MADSKEIISMGYQGGMTYHNGKDVPCDYMCVENRAAFYAICPDGDPEDLLVEAIVDEDDFLYDDQGECLGEDPESDERHYEQIKAEVIRKAAELGIPRDKLSFFRD